MLTVPLIVFVVLAILAVASAILVILSPDPVHSALWLILNLVTLGVLYYTLNASFLMAVQLIVYAGAIVVLFLFVVMVLNARGEEAWSRRLPWLRGFGTFAAALFFVAVWWAVKAAAQSETTGAPEGTPAAVGMALYTDYLLPFEATSVLLISALVGALYLGRSDARKRGSVPDRRTVEGVAPKEASDV